MQVYDDGETAIVGARHEGVEVGDVEHGVAGRLDPQHLGSVARVERGGRVAPIDRKSKYEFVVEQRDRAGAQANELVLCEPLSGRASGLPRARVIERLGSMKEFSEFLQSDGGDRLMKVLTVERGATAPRERILVAVQTGVVVVSVGVGLLLELDNTGSTPVTLTVTSNNYVTGQPRRYELPGHGTAAHTVALRDRWYDVSVTLRGDASWSRRYVGHVEDGRNSVSG